MIDLNFLRHPMPLTRNLRRNLPRVTITLDCFSPNDERDVVLLAPPEWMKAANLKQPSNEVRG